LTDFEYTEVVIEGSPSLEAGEVHYKRLERRTEPFGLYQHVPGSFNNDPVRSRLEPDPAQRPPLAGFDYYLSDDQGRLIYV
jgi:hypothetical protein